MDLFQWKQSLLDLLFPPHCIGCDALDSSLCATCLASIPLRDPGCLVCGARNRSGIFCASCKRFAPFLTRVLWASTYEIDLMFRALTQFKYNGNRALAEPLGTLIVTSLKKRVQEKKNFIPPDALLAPMPLHPRRLRARGYNQSALLASSIHQELALPILPKNTLLRVKNTNPQAKCSGGREARNKNVAGAFAIPADKQIYVRGKTILIVDDIATTGSTLNEAARVLKEAGARQIWGIVVAKG